MTTFKPEIVAIRKKVEELNKLFGGKTQIEEWAHHNQGGLRILITWRYETDPDNTIVRSQVG